MHRFNLKKIKVVEAKENYLVEVPNTRIFVLVEDLEAEVNINSAWETIRGNIKISAKERIISHNSTKGA
jgi:uncharacterized protein (DUF1499 family)